PIMNSSLSERTIKALEEPDIESLVDSIMNQ
ncbi:addiction module antitoxin, partial [Enterococcus faecalis]